jgi:hypothetical protein
MLFLSNTAINSIVIWIVYIYFLTQLSESGNGREIQKKNISKFYR